MVSPTQDRRYGVVGGIAIKAPCSAASTANLTLSGTQVVNGVSLASGDRVLVKNQTASADNGIYDVDTSSWTRAYDFNSNFDITRGTLVYVTAGTSVGKGLWTMTAANPTIGTDAITFAAVLLTT